MGLKSYPELPEPMKTLSKSMMVQTSVIIRAKDVIKNNENGTFTIVIESKGIEEKQLQQLKELFPNTLEKVFKLLDTELLLSAIV